MKLTAVQVKTAKPKEKDYKLADGKGLYLLVKKSGSKYWRYKFRFAGKEKSLAIGVFPEVSLSTAREKHLIARQQLEKGLDPSLIKASQKAAQVELSANTFQALALEWFATKMGDRSETHKTRSKRILEADLFPAIGRTPIDEISAPLLLASLRKIESRGALETARRARQLAGQVFRFAVATGRAERDPSADLQGALKVPQRTHFAAITDPQGAGRLMNAIDTYSGTAVVRQALRLNPLIFCRPTELRHLEWAEINWEASQIEIPAEKMKMKQPHIIPLSKQAMQILEEQQLLTGRGRYVFPSQRGQGRPMSENAIRVALRTMGYSNDQMTAHGFRAMARTLLDEQLRFPVEIIEQQLAHGVKDTLGRAYNRTTHLEQRQAMMQAWADYLDQLKAAALAGNVIPINKALEG